MKGSAKMKAVGKIFENDKLCRVILCLLLSLFILFGEFQINIDAKEPLSADTLSAQNVSSYQEVLDKLNEEYQYSMTFDSAMLSRGNAYGTLTDMSLEEFETMLRAEIASDIAVNQATAEANAALGDDVEWEPIPYLGKSYELPVNVSYLNSQVVENLHTDIVSFKEDLQKYGNDLSEGDTSDAADARATAKTITSIQPRQDPTGNVAFLLNADITVNSNWLYSNYNSFSYMLLGNGERYVPTSASRSFLDHNRTIAITFTCNHYSASGVLISSNSSVRCEFHTTGDCITNWPNYTISKNVTDQTYRLIDEFDTTQNCAGYAWNYDGFVSMSSLGITYTMLNNCSNLSQLRSLVKSRSQSFMSSHGIVASEISAYDTSINTATQYRVVMRVGYYDENGNGKWDFGVNAGSDSWDYHWWIQLGDGSWADKRGSFPSRIIPLSNIYTNPEVSGWRWTMLNFGEIEHEAFYNSESVYYKITG